MNKKIDDDNKYLWIADENNELLLDSTTYRLFDKNRFTYDLNRKVIILNNEYSKKETKSIRDNSITEDRMNFLKKKKKEILS